MRKQHKSFTPAAHDETYVLGRSKRRCKNHMTRKKITHVLHTNTEKTKKLKDFGEKSPKVLSCLFLKNAQKLHEIVQVFRRSTIIDQKNL